LFQTGSSRDAVVWTKDTGDNFFRLLAALLNVYSRHIRSRTPIGGLILRLCLGGLRLGLRLWLTGLLTELFVSLDVGGQIGGARLPMSNRRLHARVRHRHRRSGVLAYSSANSRRDGRARWHAAAGAPHRRAGPLGLVAGSRACPIRDIKRCHGRRIDFTGWVKPLPPLERDQRVSGTRA
jgi:hypothetical protein